MSGIQGDRGPQPIPVRGAVFLGSDHGFRVEELVLDPPGPGEVRVRMLASGVCHSDLHVLDGDWARPVPVVMGHEGAGIVEAVGRGVGGPAEGAGGPAEGAGGPAEGAGAIASAGPRPGDQRRTTDERRPMSADR